MGEHDLFVHIAAPSRVRDDAKWKNLAREIAQFRPTSGYRVLDEDTAMPQSSVTVARTDPRVPKRPLETERHQDYAGAKRVRGTSYARSKQGLNPAFCNPTLKGVKDLPSTATPAPQKQAILVPRTNTPKHGGTSPSDTDRLPASADYDLSSQESPDAVDETSFDLQHHGTQESLVMQAVHEQSSASELVSSPTECRLSQRSEHARHKADSSNGSTEILERSYSSLPGSRLEVGTGLLHATSSSEQELECARRAVLGPVSSPPEPHIESSQHTTTTSPQTLLTMVANLPREVRPPTPVISPSSRHLVLAEGLSKLAADYDLARYFRPFSVTRRAWKKERGHWRVCIFIRPHAMVEYARQAPTTLSQQKDCKFVMIQDGLLPDWASTGDAVRADMKRRPGSADADRHALWTVGEFQQFWQSTESIISRGRAGRFVRALLHTVEADEDGIRVQVRLYCNADALTHIWLMLVGLSHGAIRKMPLEWIGHDSQVVLSMPGTGRRGTAGLWTEGRDGTWGPSRIDST